MRFHDKMRLTAGAVLAALSFGVSANADEAGDKLLKQVIAKYKSMKTLSATTFQHDMADFAITMKLRKPNIYRMKFVPTAHQFTEQLHGVKVKVTVRPVLVVSDGKQYWAYYSDENHFTREAAPETVNQEPLTNLFYAPDEFADKTIWTGALVKAGSPSTMESRITGTDTIFDIPCRILEMTFSYYETPNVVTKIHKNYFYVDKNNFVRRIVETTIHAPDETDFMLTTETVKAMQTDIKMPDADFKFTPPAGAKREKQ